MNQMAELLNLPNLPIDQRTELPECSAVYFLVDQASNVLYVGKTTNLKSRWTYHEKLKTAKETPGARLLWMETPEDQIAELEAMFIRDLVPPLNSRGNTKSGVVFKPQRIRMPDEKSAQVLEEMLNAAPWGNAPDLLGQLITKGLIAEGKLPKP